MGDFMKLLLSLSVSGSILTVLLFLMKPFYRNRFRKSWQYYIWLAAVLRLLLPFTPDVTVTGRLFETAEETVGGISREIGTAGKVFLQEGDAAAPDPRSGPRGDGKNSITEGGLAGIDPWLFLCWSAAALALLLRKIAAYRGFIRSVKAQNRETPFPEELELLAESAEALKIRRPVELCYNPTLSSPVMTGFFKPCIMLPAVRLTAEEMVFIFKHELTHYRRGDMFYKWLVQAAVCVHWFNPFVYALEKEINRACELSCDEAVAGELDRGSRRAYGDLLLSFVKTNSQGNHNLASVTLSEGAGQLKERLYSIMSTGKKSRAVKAATILLTTIILFCAAASGAYAAPAKGNDVTGEADRYTYTQGGYYCDSYIFEMGWNARGKEDLPDADRVELTLGDGSKIAVYFTGGARDYSEDAKAAAAAGKLITSLNDRREGQKPVIETPVMISITPVAPGQISEYAQHYFESGDLIRFSALFPVLDASSREEYCLKIYDGDKTAFFSSVTEYMDRELILQYAGRARRDGKTNFFAMLLDDMRQEDLNAFAKMCYQENNIAQFSIIISYLPAEEKQSWLERAREDKRNTFSAVISEALYE